MPSYLANRLSWLSKEHRSELRRFGKTSLAAADTLSEVKTIAAQLIGAGCEPLLRVPQAQNGAGHSMPASPVPGLGAAPLSLAQRRQLESLSFVARAVSKARAAWWAERQREAQSL